MSDPEPRDEKIQAYGRGQISADELTDKELEMASDALDALDWADYNEDDGDE